ncbi:MAG: flagellar biosynthesis protein FlhB [Nitrospiraceae bacterium]|nr:MAG: flagellar biosynthesis protein FlhB [Nitrospiraceae bacterium]
MADGFQERTEQATPRRRQKAREQGQIARSRELTSMAVTGGIIAIFYFGGGYFFKSLTSLTGSILGLQFGRDPIEVTRIAIIGGAKVLLPFLLTSVALAVATSAMQGGVVIRPLTFEIEKMNPLAGLKKLFSMHGIAELLKSILKFAVGAWIVYYVIRKDLKVLPTLSAMEMGEMLRVSGKMIMSAMVIAFSYYMVIALISYGVERWQNERSLRMTKEEVKSELKDSEGDPKIKGRIRSIQRDIARKRMMQEVPNATVVITNPTHLAVALKYEDKKMAAPKITAKGAGVVAAKIKEIAAEHGVPIVEDKPLARTLYKLDVDTFIPEELYVAVAKLLAYIYKLKGKI